MPDHVSPVNAAFYIPQPLAPHLQNWDQPQGGPPAPPPAAGPVPAPPAGAQPPQGWSLDLGGPGAAQPASPPPYMPHQAPQQGPAIGAPAPAPGIPLPGLTPSPVPEPQFAPPTADLRPAVPDWTPPPSATPPGHPGAVPAAAFMPPPTAPAAPLPLPVTPMPAEPQFAPPAPVAPPAPSQNPFENEQSLRAPGLAPIAPPVPVTAAPPMMPLQPPDGRGVAPMAPEPMAMPGAAQAPGGEAAVAALLAGMGLGPTPALMADPNATLRSAGAALRAAIAGIRALLIARADVKREFRIEATMIGVANNPVKFSHNDDAALVALLGAASTGPAAVQETVNDLTAHQVATLAATQAAARALLDRLAPPGLEEADQGGSLFGASREKRLWESYKRLHLQVTQQFEDDFDSAFGKAFARAYEQALRDGRG